MRHHATRWFTVSTSRGIGWYRTRDHAFNAARWIARAPGESVVVTSETTGERWHVTPPGA